MPTTYIRQLRCNNVPSASESDAGYLRDRFGNLSSSCNAQIGFRETVAA